MAARGRPRLYDSTKRSMPYGGPLKRHVASSGRCVTLDRFHPARVESRTLFPNMVFESGDLPRVLIDGFNSRKIGKRVTKGRWAGLPIFTLTLEERATCPTTCRELATCYGNQMNWARRIRPGASLEAALRVELAQKAHLHPRGFVIRLHVLGDFYSTGYVAQWTRALLAWPMLRVFGFTAHAPSSPIGLAIARMSRLAGDRCWIRFSATLGPRGAIVVEKGANVPAGAVLCPMQTGKTDCCGTCGLCWTMPATVAFWRH